MKILLLFLLVALCAAVKWHELEGYTFSHYVEEFGRSYEGKEYAYRKEVFEKRLEAIREHNQNQAYTWKRGVNQLTDRTDAEFRSLLGLGKGLIPKRSSNLLSSNYDLSQYDGVNVDWRDKRIISSVKDQGLCGSCWAFGTAEVVESYWAKATGQLVSLSEQQILDCTPNTNDCGGTGGCGGGTVEIALDKIVGLGGITTEWQYPYISYYGTNSSTCNYAQTSSYARVASYVNLPTNKYAPLLVHLATEGPVAINVDASMWSDYESGVFDGCDKTNSDINHVVQLVGFGTDTDIKMGDYWLVRNSWSPAWGELGYIRLARSENVTCQVDHTPGDGTGCNGGPTSVTVCGTCGVLFDALYPVVKV